MCVVFGGLVQSTLYTAPLVHSTLFEEALGIAVAVLARVVGLG